MTPQDCQCLLPKTDQFMRCQGSTEKELHQCHRGRRICTSATRPQPLPLSEDRLPAWDIKHFRTLFHGRVGREVKHYGHVGVHFLCLQTLARPTSPPLIPTPSPPHPRLRGPKHEVSRHCGKYVNIAIWIRPSGRCQSWHGKRFFLARSPPNYMWTKFHTHTQLTSKYYAAIRPAAGSASGLHKPRHETAATHTSLASSSSSRVRPMVQTTNASRAMHHQAPRQQQHSSSRRPSSSGWSGLASWSVRQQPWWLGCRCALGWTGDCMHVLAALDEDQLVMYCPCAA